MVVIAGNYSNYDNWRIRHNLLPEHYPYVDKLRHLRGLNESKAEIILADRWESSPIFDDRKTQGVLDIQFPSWRDQIVVEVF